MTGRKWFLTKSSWTKSPVSRSRLHRNRYSYERLLADEPLFILAPIHIQLSYDNLVIPEKN